MRISAISKKTHTPIETIRYYERIGLIPRAERELSGYRNYSEKFVRYLLFIKRTKELGFTLKEIQELFSLRIESAQDCSTLHDLAKIKLDNIDARIKDLTRIQETLLELLNKCETGNASEKFSIVKSLKLEDVE